MRKKDGYIHGHFLWQSARSMPVPNRKPFNPDAVTEATLLREYLCFGAKSDCVIGDCANMDVCEYGKLYRKMKEGKRHE